MASQPVRLVVPPDAMIALVGPSGSGKSTFARRVFAPHEVLSSDSLRAYVSGDEADQSATDDAFRVLHTILDMRMRRGLLTVVDATNVEHWARRLLTDVARRYRRPNAAIVFDVPLEVALAHNERRVDKRRPPSAIRRQHRWMRESLPALIGEGFAPIHFISSVEDLDNAVVDREAPPAGSAN
jgi:predicted kinase